MRLANQLAVRNGIKNQFCKRNEKAGRKRLKNFLRRHQEISVRNLEDLSLSRAKGFTLETVAQFFETYESRNGLHHSTKSCKTVLLRLNRHHYCTAQTHENIRTEKQASDIFSSIRRTETFCDVVTCPTGLFIPPLLLFPKKI